ncbi:hypothetical protein DQT32_04295 [Salmonella enterica subsp. enterica serovar Braenderup]|nr:hypothetical protein [Salmonella enterica subsp. enterica serovar Braenderup]
MLPFARMLEYGNEIPHPTDKIKKMRSGQNHTGLLLHDGSFYVQGLGNAYQTGLNTTNDTVNFTLISTGVDDISIGYNNTFYRVGSQVFGAGVMSNYSTVIGTYQSFVDVSTTIFAGLTISQIKEIQISSSGLFALMNDGTLYAKGINTNTELGQFVSRTDWTAVAVNVIGVYAGFECSYFLKSDNTLWGCGKNSNSQLGLSTAVSTWTQISTDVYKVYAGYYNLMVIKGDGNLYVCGTRANGLFGNGTTSGNTYVLTQVLTGISNPNFGRSFLYNTGNAFFDSTGVWSTGTNAALGLGGLSTTTWTKVNISALGTIKDMTLMANGILVHDGTKIYGSGNSRLLPGISTGTTYNTFIQCVTPY